jgi:hypothetical protein
MRYMLFGVQVSQYLKKIEKHLDSVSGLGTIIEPLSFLGFWIVFYEIYALWCTGEPIPEEDREA